MPVMKKIIQKLCTIALLLCGTLTPLMAVKQDPSKTTTIFKPKSKREKLKTNGKKKLTLPTCWVGWLFRVSSWQVVVITNFM